ncbi:uncharacterized protein LOC125235859 [Leguminivora glycinivorella]|uniref:uncharacterized protein LOC125235859 n=1 Tax=Leguminivora glycinivorella TaxID=1035111 RepID=UPI00200FE701|nr:uncharacterized protein LOC125235859 [Leguminivora glycinivorella]
MCRALSVIVATLVLQTLWSSALSFLLDVSTVAPSIVDQAVVNQNEYCYSCVKIENVCYNHTELFELHAPFGENPIVQRMSIMKSTHFLYYTFEPQISDKEYSNIGFVSLRYPTLFGVIPGVPGWQFNFGPFDINQKEKKIYIGGTEGIWVVDDSRHSPKYFGLMPNVITDLAVKDYMYFTTSDNNGICKYVDGYYVVQLGDTMIKKFVLDAGSNVVYLNGTGLWISFRSKSQKDVRLSTERFIRGLTVDMKGTVYAWHVDGIYKVT